MKAARHAMIQEIVENNEIKTQEELAQALRARGVSVTQATVSRDIKALRLLKVLSKDGGYKYATADKAQSGMAERFIRIFHDSVLSVAQANNLLVLNTISGSAHVAGEAIDTLHWPEIVGTISGDNTILVILPDETVAKSIHERFLGMMH